MYQNIIFLVSSIYLEAVIRKHNGKAVYLICLVYLCHAFTGIYCSIISFATCILSGVINHRLTREFQKCLTLHLKVLLYLSWLIIPCLISYPYIGGESVKRYGGFTLPDIVDMFNNGLLFDWKRNLPWMTILVSVGLIVSVKHTMDFTVRVCGIRERERHTIKHRQHQIHAWWLLLVTAISCFLYTRNPLMNGLTNVMPFDFDFDNKLFIIGIHFCGLLMAAKALCWLTNLTHYFAQFSLKKKRLYKMVTVFVTSLVLIKNGVESTSERLSVLEVSGEFCTTLNKMKVEHEATKRGRILSHSRLGN